MSEIVVVANLQSLPDQSDALKEALSELVPLVHAEDGNLLYALHQGVDDPTQFAFVERWASRDALDAHARAPHMAATFAKIGGLVAGPPSIVYTEAVPAGDATQGTIG